MNEIILKHEEIDTIFKSHLKIESKVMSIESIFNNPRVSRKINYKPYYQRNYVWDNEKATYFIESILIGTEIPPLVFFRNKNIEIIDGRQRYETIKNFIDKKLTLTNKGLHSLESFSKKNFDDLDRITKEIFLNTQIRILEFSVVNEPKLNDRKEDLIKKEIFRRYNSGITPLKKPEIERALFISDDFTKRMKSRFREDHNTYELLVRMFLSERDHKDLYNRSTYDKLMSKIRQLLVLHYIPIKKYSYGNNRNDLLKSFYDIYAGNIENFDEFYEKLTSKVLLLEKLFYKFSKNNSYAQNKLIYECTLWMYNILEVEGKLDIDVITNEMENYYIYLCNNIEEFTTASSHFYKNVLNRYNSIAVYIKNNYDINISIYIDNNISKVDNSIEEKNQNKNFDLEKMRLSKPEPTSMTIDDISRMMERNRFLIRPPYQRQEVINTIKSSALIESILLGIKLPPIFVYRKSDGTHEVIDGQQRLLSILGFIGAEFIDEEGKSVRSDKNKFKLKGLRILSDSEGATFEDLDEDKKDRIYDFSLSVVIIDEKINPSFDSIDLFIRLNNKPYPVRDNTFEMWNSYIDKEIISSIKENFTKHQNWFYYKIVENDNRMSNYELYTSIAYLEYKKSIEENSNIEQYLNIYQRNNNINTRIKQKKDITKILDSVTIHSDKKDEFMKCITNVEQFIQKLENILCIEGNIDTIDLNNELNKLMGLKKQKRTAQSFYSIWMLVNDLSIEDIENSNSNIKADLQKIILGMKNYNDTSDGRLDDYMKKVEGFRATYSMNVD